jgi:uncharacterized phage protein (TIGR02218 family)
MPRSLSNDLLTLLDGSIIPLANYTRITRLDGVVLGFTSYDRDLTFGGVTYEAYSSVSASAVRQSEGTGVDNLDIIGLLTSSRIRDTDILAGLYDGAAVELGQVNYLSPEGNAVIHLTGTLGEITEREGEYTAEIRSLSQHLAQQVGALTSATCRVRAFGDSECIPPGDPGTTLVLAAHQYNRTVGSVTSSTVIVFSSDSLASNGYRYGRVVFTSGLNNGIAREVKSHTLSGGTAVITLQEAFPFTVSPGDTAMLEEGCDRGISRCLAFSNVINFAGEPHIPGNFLVLRRGRR